LQGNHPDQDTADHACPDQDPTPAPAIQQRTREGTDHRIRQQQQREPGGDPRRLGLTFGAEQHQHRQGPLQGTVTERAEHPDLNKSAQPHDLP